MAAAGVVAGVPVVVRREAAADVIPRFDGATLRFTSKRALEAPARGGLVLGPVLLDVDDEGRLEGATLLEERRYWERATVAWELPGRASPHRLDITGAAEPGPTSVAVRWDGARSLCAVVFTVCEAPLVVALGPRAYAAVADDRLVGLLADLRGFDRATG
jgi:hypothetical protein